MPFMCRSNRLSGILALPSEPSPHAEGSSELVAKTVPIHKLRERTNAEIARLERKCPSKCGHELLSMDTSLTTPSRAER